MRAPITAEEYLSVALRFLATGESYASLAYQFRMSTSTLCYMVPYTCKVIYQVLCTEYLHCPNTEEEWLVISQQFESRWQFPNCIGAGDGKHIRIRCPANSGSEYFNYKGFFSLVLLAFVGPDYRFLYIDVGCQGSASDGGVFRNTSLWKALNDGTLNLPQPKTLPQSPDLLFENNPDLKIEHFFVCDDAFPLGIHLMKPYSKRKLTEEQRIFNYRLSRARRISENAFGIMSVRFRVLYSMMCLNAENATQVTLACCALHNMLMVKASSIYAPPDTFDHEFLNGKEQLGTWRKNAEKTNFTALPKTKERCSRNAEEMRNLLCEYVNGPGAIPWQYRHVVA